MQLALVRFLACTTILFFTLGSLPGCPRVGSPITCPHPASHPGNGNSCYTIQVRCCAHASHGSYPSAYSLSQTNSYVPATADHVSNGREAHLRTASGPSPNGREAHLSATSDPSPKRRIAHYAGSRAIPNNHLGGTPAIGHSCVPHTYARSHAGPCIGRAPIFGSVVKQPRLPGKEMNSSPRGGSPRPLLNTRKPKCTLTNRVKCYTAC